MVLKLNTGINNDWVYFEAQEISIQRVLADKVFDSEAIWILQDGTEKQKKKDVNYIHFIYETGTKRIITNRVGYLLNNEGKTIDRI